ncbi:ATP-binding protein [Streptomyces sp. S1D4-20]|uniref:sensor histidine kinase n=1 Tax=Streptomyces sp. S1D4-20 TaxID=2594462 RepID=UPI00116303B7|nr:ATP-binding protein [Streptomyces sp. S1D4-20]QDN54247.1 sensor histidine kinase [Streptomyces sp. S1D4-20]
MTPRILDPVVWLLALALAAAVATAIRLRRTVERERRRIKELETSARALEGALSDRDSEAAHLAAHQIPTLMKALWSGQYVQDPGCLHPELADTAFGQARTRLLDIVRDTTVQSAERAERATQTTLKTVIRSIQPLVNELQGAAVGMVERHHDEKVLEDAIEISHGGNQLARRLQALNVLIGTWPGRQRDPSPLLDVVRGGVSRIRDYDRIHITGAPAFAVTSRAVEPVALCLAELLDNAARHSEPGTQVQVWFVPAHHGVTVYIDDSGIGMKPEDRTLAAQLLSGQQRIWITQLQNPPRFGFAAAGQFCVRYGFQAGADQTSATGGVRAWVFVPKELLVPVADLQTAAVQTRPDQPDVTAGAEAAVTAPEPVTMAAPAPEPPQQFEMRPDGLPQRRRNSPGPRHAASRQLDAQPPSDGGRNVGAFLRGVQRATTQSHPSPTEGTSSDDDRRN